MAASGSNNPGVVYVNVGPYPQPASPVGPGRHQEPLPAPRGSKFHVLVDRTVYVAGEPVQGRLSAQVQADWVVQSVTVTVAGVQHALVDGSPVTLRFFENRVVLAAAGAPVVAGSIADQLRRGERLVLPRGKTSIPFNVPVRPDLPSSFTSKRIRLVYTVTAEIYGLNGELLRGERDVMLVERLDQDEMSAIYDPVYGRNQKRLMFGGEGVLDLQCQVQKSVFRAGDIVYLALGVRNATKRKIHGVVLKLVQRKTVFATPHTTGTHSGRDRTREKILMSRDYLDRDFAVEPSESHQLMIDFDLPTTIRRIRKCPALEVTYQLHVELVLRGLGRNPSVELNIDICHPASVEPPPVVQMEQAPAIVSTDFEDHPEHTLGRRHHQRAQSPPSAGGPPAEAPALERPSHAPPAYEEAVSGGAAQPPAPLAPAIETDAAAAQPQQPPPLPSPSSYANRPLPEIPRRSSVSATSDATSPVAATDDAAGSASGHAAGGAGSSGDATDAAPHKGE